jgi:hypothetical protein
MWAMGALLTRYGTDADVTDWVDGLEIWCAPVVNPDGHDYVFGGNPSWEDWRKTLRDNNENGQVDFPDDGVDMNRNWDWHWSEYGEHQPSSQKYKGPSPFSEPEVRALRDFTVRERPVLVIDYHSPVTISWTNKIFYPWVSQHGGGHSPDFDIAGDIAGAWAARTQTSTGGSFSSIFGYDTLPKEQCWVYGNTGIITYVMEIGDQCWYSGANVDTVAARVARGSEYLLERALEGPGITGRVIDAQTGQPLQAEVVIPEMHSEDVGPRLCEAGFGQFHRLTSPGSYTVEVSMRDYVPQSVPVTVGGLGWTVADFALVPETTTVGEGQATAPRERWLQIANPVRRGQPLRVVVPAGVGAARVDLFDPLGRRVAVVGRGLAAQQTHSLRMPADLAAGIYLLRVQAGDEQQVIRVVIVE